MRALARSYTAPAVAKLAEWMASDNAKASVSACVALLDRGWGRPAQALTDADGGTLTIPAMVLYALQQQAE